MPSVAVKLYSVFFKFLLRHRLQSRGQFAEDAGAGAFGITSRPEEESTVPANASFTDGIATKDIHIDSLTSLSVRIFLPDSSLHPPFDPLAKRSDPRHNLTRRNSYAGDTSSSMLASGEQMRRSSYGGEYGKMNGVGLAGSNGHLKPPPPPQDDSGIVYRGYLPNSTSLRRLPIVLQFHGGGYVSGCKDSYATDFFCRRIAKICDVIVVSVGYRLAPENRYPAAFEDGLKVLNWLAKQANLAECSKSLGSVGMGDLRKSDARRHMVDTFGASIAEPWLAAHGDPSRCVLLGVSCGANIADFVARKAVEAGKLLEPVKVVAQVLMYPFFIGSIPTRSEIKLANSYFYDKGMCIMAWKLFLPEDEFSLDHPAANPLIPGREPPLKFMPPTLTVVAEHDWMRDRAIAYSEELRKVNIDAPVLEYKDAVHEFATLEMLLKSPQAQVVNLKLTLPTLSKMYSVRNEKDTLIDAVSLLGEYVKDEPWMKLLCDHLRLDMPTEKKERPIEPLPFVSEDSPGQNNKEKTVSNKKQPKKAKLETGSKNIRDMFRRASSRNGGT